jgi:hypothetical protein
MLIFLIKPFSHASKIIFRDSSILHELDRTLLKRRASLRSIISYSKDSISIYHWYSWIYWIKVSSNILKRFMVILLNIPSWSIVENSLLHLKSIRVSPECLII